MEKKLANSSWCCKNIDDALALVKANRHLEWDLNTLPFSLNVKRMTYVRDFIKDNGEVRFHLPHSFWDIGVSIKNISENSFEYYCRLFEMIKFLNAKYVVLHIGAATGSDEETSLKNLLKLAKCANDNGVMICVENLVYGLPSDMTFIKKCLEIPYVNMCLDIGHAERICRKQGEDVFNMISSFKDKILHAHVYHFEDENLNHKLFTAETISDNKWLKLLQNTPCEWYTMELDFKEEQEIQRILVENFLKAYKNA